MENVPHINPYQKTVPWTQLSQAPRPKRNWRKKPGRRPGKHFVALSRLVGDTHRDLFEKKSPFRLCVHKTNDDVFMDIVTMNASEKIDHMFTRLITNDDMNTLTKRIHNRMGLLMDCSV